jgi:hypothetical protein
VVSTAGSPGIDLPPASGAGVGSREGAHLGCELLLEYPTGGAPLYTQGHMDEATEVSPICPYMGIFPDEAPEVSP